MAAKLGIIAGRGDLPRRLIDAALGQGRQVFVLALKDQADADIGAGVDHAWIRLGQAGTGIDRLKAEGCKELIMAGGVHRPSPFALLPDARTAKFLAKGAFKRGDDGLLSAIAGELEAEGFKIIGAHELLPELLAPGGVLSQTSPDEQADQDIAEAMVAALELGRLDKGQAAVAESGRVLAVEDVDGTDAMLARVAEIKDRSGPGGVLVKLSKPGQDERVDLPTIGVETLENAHKAGLRGVAVEAGSTLMVDYSDILNATNRLGLFLVGVEVSNEDL